MTDEVATLVLRHNDGQNMALAVPGPRPAVLHVHARYLRQLERDKRLAAVRTRCRGTRRSPSAGRRARA